MLLGSHSLVASLQLQLLWVQSLFGRTHSDVFSAPSGMGCACTIQTAENFNNRALHVFYNKFYPSRQGLNPNSSDH